MRPLRVPALLLAVALALAACSSNGGSDGGGGALSGDTTAPTSAAGGEGGGSTATTEAGGGSGGGSTGESTEAGRKAALPTVDELGGGGWEEEGVNGGYDILDRTTDEQCPDVADTKPERADSTKIEVANFSDGEGRTLSVQISPAKGDPLTGDDLDAFFDALADCTITTEDAMAGINSTTTLSGRKLAGHGDGAFAIEITKRNESPDLPAPMKLVSHQISYRIDDVDVVLEGESDPASDGSIAAFDEDELVSIGDRIDAKLAAGG